MSKKTVLICDDEPLIREAISYSVKKEGHEILMAADGGEALLFSIEKEPDLILLDVGMPVMTGFEVCEKLRAQPNGDKYKIIIITAFGQAADIEKAKKVGATQFISKPFSPRALQEVIAELLPKQSDA